MKQPEISLPSFVMRSILNGLWTSATGILIAMWLILVVLALLALTGIPAPYILPLETVELFQGVRNAFVDILYFLYIVTGFTILGFLLLVVPITILPALLGSVVLSIWLYQDTKNGRLSVNTAQWKGAVIGVLGCAVALFTPLSYFAWPSLWLQTATHPGYFPLFWLILIVAPAVGALIGRSLGKSLARELAPREEFFSVDWESLKQEGQKEDSLPE